MGKQRSGKGWCGEVCDCCAAAGGRGSKLFVVQCMCVVSGQCDRGAGREWCRCIGRSAIGQMRRVVGWNAKGVWVGDCIVLAADYVLFSNL